MKLFASALVTASLLMTGSVFAGGHAKWTAVEDQSRIAFGSIKSDTVGEVHHFEGVTGTVGEDGKLTLAVDLGSLKPTSTSVMSACLSMFFRPERQPPWSPEKSILTP